MDVGGSLAERLAAARTRERWVAAYREAPGVFATFEAAEDPDGAARARLVELARIEGEVVLELGAGTGWLTRRVAPLAARTVALEPALGMLRTANLAGAKPVSARAESLPLATASVSRVVASFVLLDLRPELRPLVLAECERVLAPRPDAAIWVIENAGTGEYQELRGIADRTGGLGESRPLVDELGFECVDVFETELVFQDAGEAAAVLGTILGTEVRTELERSPRTRLGLDLALLRRSRATRP
jgi:SAM-dependent methyltransferase